MSKRSWDLWRLIRPLIQIGRLASTGRQRTTALKQVATAVLTQQEDLIRHMSDEMYAKQCPLVEGTTGQHIRHALDHVTRPLLALSRGSPNSEIFYDRRERNTKTETDRAVALEVIQHAKSLVRCLELEDLEKPIGVTFMLSASGDEHMFSSTVGREIYFSIHHAIHHNAMIRCILERGNPKIPLPPEFGLAPSTENFLRT